MFGDFSSTLNNYPMFLVQFEKTNAIRCIVKRSHYVFDVCLFQLIPFLIASLCRIQLNLSQKMRNIRIRSEKIFDGWMSGKMTSSFSGYFETNHQNAQLSHQVSRLNWAEWSCIRTTNRSNMNFDELLWVGKLRGEKTRKPSRDRVITRNNGRWGPVALLPFYLRVDSMNLFWNSPYLSF